MYTEATRYEGENVREFAPRLAKTQIQPHSSPSQTW